ncbi:MAG: hypothetical protein K6F94_05075 [Bacteroidaceae bacterium]|nr:hypothetical protein [Bacteroidaceae bacterium]
MKHVFYALLALFMLTSVNSYAQYDKALRKAQEKEYKQKMKQYKKEKWTIYGSAHSLEVALLKHYKQLEQLGDNGVQVMGEASNFKSKNIGKQAAMNNACVTYARNAGSTLKGRIATDMMGDADDSSKEFDRFYAAYSATVEKEIKGEMRESFSIIQTNKDGTFNMQVYYIVDEEAASKARVRALNNALQESQAAQKYADKIKNFVEEGVVQE